MSDAVFHLLQMFWVLNNVQVIGVYRQNGSMVKWLGEKIFVGDVEFIDVRTLHLAFIWTVT